MFPDLRGYSLAHLRADIVAALTVLFISVPAGIAYARIADLPPALGLWAGAVPVIVSSVFRDNRHVLSGPSNAVSLLVGGAMALGLRADPVTIAVTLAFLVGAIQVAAGVLRLGSLVDFVSTPVVLGYITGAAVLIGVGQLHHLTATAGARGPLWERLGIWLGGLDQTAWQALVMGLGTLLFIVVVRRINRRLPAAMLAMTLAIALTLLFDLQAAGLRTVGQIAPIPAGLPPFTLPDLHLAAALLPLAGATATLSLIESTSVARSISAKTGDPLNPTREFIGQGLSNLSAAFTGGYPVSGSLSRSGLNHQVGARTRLAGVLTGVMMIVALLFLAPLLDATPVAALAGLLVIVAWDLIDVVRIRRVIRSSGTDAIAFVITVVGTWSLELDYAVYLGVGISLVMLLRQMRMLNVRQLRFDEEGRIYRSDAEDAPPPHEGMVILNVQGRLFFGAVQELRSAVERRLDRDRGLRVVVLRLGRTRGMDVTVVDALQDLAARLERRGGSLHIAGVSARVAAVLERVWSVGPRPTIHQETGEWLGALTAATRAGLRSLGEEDMPALHVRQSVATK